MSSPPSTERSVRSQFRPASRRAASPDATSDGEHGRAEEHCVRARLSTSVASASTRGCGSGESSSGDSRRVDLRRAERAGAGSDPGRALAEHDTVASPSDAAFPSTPSASLLERAVVVLEEDERLHRSFRSTTRSRIFCAAEPSSSIFTWSPRDGGGPRSRTVVFAPPRPPSRRPRRCRRARASPAASSSRP